MPDMGWMAAAWQARLKATAPYRAAVSVRAKAGRPSAAACALRAGTLVPPSRE